MCTIVPHLPHNAVDLGTHLKIPNLHELISCFLYEQENPDEDRDDIPLDMCPAVKGKVHVFPSAVATYYAPSDKSGIQGMLRERIHAVDSWCKGPGRHNTIFLSENQDLEAFKGFWLHVFSYFSESFITS